ncbi:MAG TPA: 16S rRNA (guanine(527)-N(7))-methyltransferase RsmG [Candidatus Baltobacteraceae bacterium]|nr:16S rRNA (guanine(527)-N(7))-methyltransferase RsmG [Candidatus Baltobacteraceae bacterium]
MRDPLPDDPAGLPPLPVAVRRLIEAGCASWGVILDERAMAALDAHARLLLAWTAAINLTAVRLPERLAVLHVLDSLSAVPLLRRAVGPRPRLADIGSGGGYPALPLAIVLPASQVVLIESIGKKARFLEVASAAVGRVLGADGTAPDLHVERRRAEALAGPDGRCGVFDVVTVRAVGSLAHLAALGLPLLRPGGLLVAWKRDAGDGALEAEVGEARPIIARLGGAPPRVETVRVPPGATGLEGHRLVLVRAGRGGAPASGRSRLLG